MCACAFGQETKGGCWSGRGPLQEELELKPGGQGLGPLSPCSGPVPPFTATPHLLHFSSGSGTIHNMPSSMSLLSGPFQQLSPLVEIPLKRKNHFLSMLDSMWALNSPTRGQTHALCIAFRVLTPRPPFEVLKCPFFSCSLKMPSHPSVRILKPRSPLSGEDFAVCCPTHSSQSASPLIRHIKFFFFFNFIYLFLVVLGLRCYTQPFSSCGAQAAHCVVTSLVEHGRQQLWHMGWATSRHVGSSRTRDRTRGSCIGRWILYH